MINNHLFINGMPAQSIPNWEDFLFFRSFSYGKNKGGGGNEGAQKKTGMKTSLIYQT